MADHNRWMRFYPRDYLADTRLLTTEEHGAYLLLLLELFLRDGKLPADPEVLQALTLVRDAGRWKRIWGKISHHFQLAENGTVLVQRRVLLELEQAKARIEVAASGGRASGRNRSKRSNSSSTPVEPEMHSGSTDDAAADELEANYQEQEQGQINQDQISPPPAPAHTRSTSGAKLWTVHDWREQFGRAWAAKYQRPAYGDAGDTKAVVSLGYVLDALPESERLEAQQRAPGMFAEFLSSLEPRLIQRRHPFVFFVQEWGGLRVPKKALPVDARCAFHRQGFRGRLPREGAHDGCPECKHAKAGQGGRVGEPTPAGDAMAVVTDRKLAEMRKAADRIATPDEIARAREEFEQERRQPAKAAVS